MSKTTAEQEQVEEHIIKRFDLQEYKGKGAYGIVWKAFDKKTKQTVALKKVFDAFQNSTDAQRTYREVVFLKQLNNHENIIKLISVIRADNNKDLYMVFEYMETDLHRVIRADLLNSAHIQYVMYQLMKCLKYIHSGLLVHRDLKPANLLVNASCQLKVADFGLARCIAKEENNEETPIMTEYVATRWYRAPEILYGSHDYSCAVDMWSVGCIMGEMLLGRAIFAGSSTIDQIDKIVQLLGRPNSQELYEINAPLASQILEQIKSQKKFSFASFFPKANEIQIDLLRKLLTYNPRKRITAVQALDHPYFKDFKGSEPEPLMDDIITIPINDNKKLKMLDYRDALYSGQIQKKKLQPQPTANTEAIQVQSDSKQYYTRCKSRVDQRSQSVNKKVASQQNFNQQDFQKFQKYNSKSYHIEAEEVPTVHKSYADMQLPVTNKKKKTDSSRHSRCGSAEGTLTQQLILQAQQNFNRKMKTKTDYKAQIFQCQGFIKKKSKTPDNFVKMQRSYSQNKNTSVSRSSSKPKTRGSPYHTDSKMVISQPDMPNNTLNQSLYKFGQYYAPAVPLYQKILSKHQSQMRTSKQFNYESLKK